LLLIVSAAASAQMPPFAGAAGAQMPDPKQLSGQPLPVSDLTAGTVVVRVIRGQMTNILQGQHVTLTVDGQTRSVTTDQSGHAQFGDLPIGAQAQATVAVDGETIDSQSFAIPSSGGIRLVLVATDPDAEKKAAADQKLAHEAPIDGVVVLGDQSRFVAEIADDALNVYNILPIVNTAKRPVRTRHPLVIDLPQDAIGLGLLQGSTQNAVASGTHVVVNGPFAPGTTLLQFAYSLPLGRDSITVSETIPAPMPQFALVAQKVGNMQVSSPQLSEQRDVPADGQNYIAAEGGAVNADGVLTLTFSGLPHKPAWPRDLALASAVSILLTGAWAAARRPNAPGAADRRRQLQLEQSRLYAELAALEGERREGRVSAEAFAARRADVVDALEAVYARLDPEAAA
jgi:hypothetical protein